MIKEIIPEQLSPDMKQVYDNWLTYFTSCIKKSGFIPFKEFEGEDKNILSWQSKEDYIKWWGQSPDIIGAPYRDDCFYTRELTWLSEWCKPSTVVEIGTDKGMGTFLLDRLNPYAEIYTIDIVDLVPMPGDTRVETGFFSKLNQCPVHYVSKIPNLTFNFIFIDGDHSEVAVWEDSLWAWNHIDRTRKGVILWHDARQNNEEFKGLLKALNRFSIFTRKPIYKFKDSSTVWMFLNDNI